MASDTLPVFSHPHFPQVFTAAIDAEICRVERVLGSCCYSNRWASCQQKAVVSDLETGCGYCLMHFGQEVDCG